MLEFVFFDPRPRRRFVDFLQTLGVSATELEDDETFGVAIPEDVADELMDEIESCYDEMMAFNQALFEADAEDAATHAAGVVLNLASGETVYAQVDPVLLGRIMEVVTPQEFGAVVNAIVDAVENPDSRSLCRRPLEPAR
jgi:hypothetical protein